MGAWGTGIVDNDTTCDIRGAYRQKTKDLVAVAETTVAKAAAPPL